MKVNKRAKMFLIIGCIVLIATVTIFSTTHAEIILPHVWLGFFSMIFAELIFFFGSLAIECFAENSEQILVRAGGGTVVTIYSVLAFVISLVYVNMPVAGIRTFMILQIVLFAIAAILEIIFIGVAKSAYTKNKRTLTDVMAINDMIDSLVLLESNIEYKKQLDKLIEDLKYSDLSVAVDSDSYIQAKIAKLELEFAKNEINQSMIDTLIEDIAILIKKRKIQVKSSKLGGI